MAENVAKVQGFPLDPNNKLVSALVNRCGGSVRLSVEEVEAAVGFVVTTFNDGSFEIETAEKFDDDHFFDTADEKSA